SGLRVDARGMIRMPLIEREIQAACRTERELAQEITTLYLEYQRNPRVDVYVSNYQSQYVTVLGAINTPGRFVLQRPVRLMELLLQAGGAASGAGRSVQIIHSPTAFTCEAPAAVAGATPDTSATAEADADEDPSGSIDSYNLNDIMRGDERANVFVRSGDLITIPPVEQAFVFGNVAKPSNVLLTEPITISRAITMLGGVLPNTRSEKIRIIRYEAGRKTELAVNLKAIDKGEAEDVLLRGNDIVDVPAATPSGKKKILMSLQGILGGVLGSVGGFPLGQLPTRVIQ
ncbi:MAG: polysaccharide biosynthesis/export family protein, partial [Pyrinomonadaceae bacterium]